MDGDRWREDFLDAPCARTCYSVKGPLQYCNRDKPGMRSGWLLNMIVLMIPEERDEKQGMRSRSHFLLQSSPGANLASRGKGRMLIDRQVYIARFICK